LLLLRKNNKNVLNTFYVCDILLRVKIHTLSNL
jgi:hypothetical protein